MNQLSSKDCVILVPCGEAIAATCEQSLRMLESRGYTVRRVRGFSQIDVARNCIASTAVQDAFAETLWIDSDIGFEPDDVERLRSHQLPVVAGLYAKKGQTRIRLQVPSWHKQGPIRKRWRTSGNHVRCHWISPRPAEGVSGHAEEA